MTVLDLQLIPSRSQSLLKTIDLALTRWCDRLLEAGDRARQRRQLLGLSDAALKDFAASRADAEREAR